MAGHLRIPDCGPHKCYAPAYKIDQNKDVLLLSTLKPI